MVKKTIFLMVIFWNLPLWADEVQTSTVPANMLAISSSTASVQPAAPGGMLPAAAVTVPSAVIPVAAPPPPARSRAGQVAMNEMMGTVESVSSDPQVLRVTVDGGYNVEFTYDAQTEASNGGHDLKVGDLNYGDKVVVRYIGRDLVAREVERISKAAPPAISNPEQPAPMDNSGAAPLPAAVPSTTPATPQP